MSHVVPSPVPPVLFQLILAAWPTTDSLIVFAVAKSSANDDRPSVGELSVGWAGPPTSVPAVRIVYVPACAPGATEMVPPLNVAVPVTLTRSPAPLASTR